MPNFQRPDGDQTVNNWTSTPLWQKIDEAVASDSDFVQSENDPSNDIMEVTLGNLTDPAVSTGHIVRYRLSRAQSGGGQPGTLNVIVGLYQATTLIASATHNNINLGFAEFSFTLTGGEADNITDYDDLRIRVDADKSAGARTTWCELSHAEFETPSAPATLVQANYRIRDNDDELINSTTFSDALNTGATLDLETRFRIRFEIDETGATEDIDTYELWASIEGGAYAKVATTPLDWTTRTTVALIEHVDSKQYANSAATTDILSGADAFTAGDGVGEGGVTDSITLNDQHTEIEYCLILHRIADGPTYLNDTDTVDFRVRKADDSVLDTYTNTPQIIVNEPAGQIGGVYAENPGNLGPFEDGNGNKYVVIEPTSSDAVGMMMKSADGGDTWDEVDGAGRPSTTDLEGLHIVQDATNNRLLVFHHKGDNPRLNIFNTSDHGTPDEWSTVDESIDSAILDAGDQQITGWLRSDGTMVAVYTGDTNATATNFDVWANIRSSGGTWGTPFLVWNLSNNANEGVVGVLGDNDNVYVFAVDQAAGDLFGKTIRGSDDTLRDLFDAAVSATVNGTSVDANVGTTNDDRQGCTQPQYWDDGGTDKIFIAWKDATDGDLEGVVIEVGSGGSVGTVGAAVNDADDVANSFGASRQPIASIIRHTNGDLHAFFATEPLSGSLNSNLLHDVSTDDGATWGTDETVTVRSPKSRINWVRAFEQPDGNIGLFYDDASGTEQNNTAAGGDDTVDAAGYATGFIWYDEFVTATAHTETPTEAAGVTDGVSRIHDAKRTPTDPVGAADTVAVAKATTAPITEPVGAADSVVAVKAITVGITEPVGVTDVVVDDLTTSGHTEEETEPVGVTDSTTRAMEKARALAEAAGVTDSVARVIDAARTVTEPVGVADSTAPAKWITVVATEAVGILDGTRTAFEVTLGDTANPTDNSNHELQVRAQVATGTATLHVELRQGSTLIEAFSQALTTSFVDYAFAISTGNAATITDYSDLSVYGYVEPGATGETQISRLRLCLPALRAITDPVGIADSISTQLTITAEPTEAVGISDATTRVVDAAREATEAAGLADSTTRALIAARAVTEAVGASDETLAAKTITVVVTDPVGVADSTVDDLTAGATDYTEEEDEAVGVTDDTAAAKAAARIVDEPAGVADSTTRVVDAARIVDEPAGVTDGIAAAKAITVTVNEPAGIADDTATKLTIAEIVDEPAGVADSTSRVVDAARAVTDPAGVADTVGRVHDAKRTPTEAAGVTDDVARVVDAARATTDPVGITDAIATKLTIAAEPTDPVGVADDTTPVKAAAQELDEPVGIADGVAAAKTIRVTVDEPVGASDTTADDLSAGAEETITDPAGILDSTTRVVEAARTISDPAGVTDTAVAAKTIRITVTEPIAAADTTTPAKTTAVETTDPVGIADTTTPAKAATQNLLEPVGVADSTTRVMVWIRSSTEAVGISDEANIAVDYARTATDAVGITDDIADLLLGPIAAPPISRILRHQGRTGRNVANQGKTGGTIRHQGKTGKDIDTQ